MSTPQVYLEDIKPDVAPIRSFNGSSALNIRQADSQDIEADRNSHDTRSVATRPSLTVDTLERWNHPRRNVWGVSATFMSFLVLGLNDATPGALIPYLESYYNINYTVVSLIFLSPFMGYSAASLSNHFIHRKFGQRGIAMGAPLCHIVAYLTLSLHPPWPVLVVFCIAAGFGNGLADAGWCAWTGNMAEANKVQGILMAFYSLGATISPLIATSMITQAGLPWFSWYYVMTGASVLEFFACTWAFWPKTGARYRADNPKATAGNNTWQAIKNKVTLICALFFLIYVGAEVALGGWIVTFMLRERDASSYASGISVTGFWAGQCVGRALLGFITERYGERLCVCIYLAISIALELIFWLVPKFIVSAVAVALLGFFIGPLFPAGVVMCAKLLPKHLHVSALGFATALAGVGGSLVPFAVGAIAQSKGVWVLQPIILTLLVVMSALWVSFPRIGKKRTA